MKKLLLILAIIAIYNLPVIAETHHVSGTSKGPHDMADNGRQSWKESVSIEKPTTMGTALQYSAFGDTISWTGETKNKNICKSLCLVVFTLSFLILIYRHDITDLYRRCIK